MEKKSSNVVNVIRVRNRFRLSNALGNPFRRILQKDKRGVPQRKE